MEHLKDERTSSVGTDLAGASFCYASIIDADFTDAILLDVNLQGATYTRGAKWPQGFNPEAYGARLVT